MKGEKKKRISFISVIIQFIVGFSLFCLTGLVNASSELIEARIGNAFYDNLEDAISNASSNDVIYLMKNIQNNSTLEINKTININLNGKNIMAPSQVFLVKGGSLNLVGKGEISETEPYYGAVVIVGSNNSNDTNYSTLNVGEDVKLIGWSGVFVDHENSKSYGVLVNVDGEIAAVNDIDGGTGIGVYVNGNITDINNAPVINLNSSAIITSSGNGIYSAGYATYNINGAYIEGLESALGIKSGVFNINKGTLVGSGDDKTPTFGNNNGINPSGVAIQIESNNGYAGNIELYIKDGLIKSLNSNVLYEYVVDNTDTKVKSISLTGGTYLSDNNSNVFRMSDSFNSKHQSFVSGGKYSSSPNIYLKAGYETNIEDDLYVVLEDVSSVFNVFKTKNGTDTWFLVYLVIISALIISVYIYRKRYR